MIGSASIIHFIMRGSDNVKIGYVRASTTDQNTARQEVLMESLGVD